MRRARATRSEQLICPMTPREAVSIAARSIFERGGRGRIPQSRETSSIVANTTNLLALPPTARQKEPAHLISFKDSPKAVEELEWRDDSALDQPARQQRRCCPPPRADRHFPKPFLQRQTTTAVHSLIHAVVWRKTAGLVLGVQDVQTREFKVPWKRWKEYAVI